MFISGNKIVALVDGSLYSASVCDHAAWFANKAKVGVEIVHVLGRAEHVEAADHSGAIALGARTALLEELADLDQKRAKLMAQKGRAILEDARLRLENAGIADVSERLLHGDLLDSLPDLEQDARVILMGKRGEAADFAKGHLGSNLERVVRASEIPVLVAARAFKPISKVLLAFDGGPSSMKALDHIASSPVFAGLEVHVASAHADESQAQLRLAIAEAALQKAGFAPQLHVVNGPVDQALAGLIEANGFDLLVMGAYGHSRIRNLVIGSTTEHMVRGCKVPIILMR